MSLRFITGRSGQGKTKMLVEEAVRYCVDHPDKRVYVIVPEQFSMEMQQKMIENHPRHGFFNLDVLSFHRLAYRIFDECGFTPRDILEDLGVSMVLRKVLSEMEEELSYFKKSIKKAGFIDELKSALMELIGYGISFEQLEELDDFPEEDKNLQEKCVELGKIYENFTKKIESRFMVTEQILDVAGEYVEKASMLKDAIFYFDGFTGFTPVQLTFMQKLLCVAKQINVTLTIPGVIPGKKEIDQELFYSGEKTARALLKICRDCHQDMDDIVVLDDPVPLRFKDREELAFLEKNIFRPEKKCYENSVDHIHLTVCHNPDGEASYIMHKIEQLVRQKGYRYRDFAVLCTDVAQYSSAFERNANILNIPLFEDTKKKVSYHSSVESIRALFHLVSMDYSYESVFRYLKSGMSDLKDEETDYLENYVLSAGIRGYSMWKKPFERRLSGKEKEDVEFLEKLRQMVLKETEEFYLEMKRKDLCVRDKMELLFHTMDGLRFEEKLRMKAQNAESRKDYGRAKEYEQLYSLILALMDKIVMIFGEETMSVKELSEIMDAGLEELGLGIVPLSMDQVVLGDLKRTRLHEIRVLFIAGMNDGLIPPDLSDRGIIRDEEKEILKKCGISLSQNLVEQSMEDEFYMYLAFCKPSEELYFSYSVSSGNGEGLRPSVLIKNCSRLFPKLEKKRYPEEEPRYYFNEEDSKEFLLEQLVKVKEHPEETKKNQAFSMLLGYWSKEEKRKRQLLCYEDILDNPVRSEQLPKKLMEELYGKEIEGSVTRLERFAACPYQYFCIYGLELFEREEYKVRAVDLGNIFHRALEYFSNKIKESDYTWKTIPREAMDQFMEDALNVSLAENAGEIFRSSARNEYKLRTIRRILKRTIEILQIQLKYSEFEPDRFELYFGKNKPLSSTTIPLSEGRKMTMQGVIDRVDVCQDGDRIYMRVIDYKSGIKKFELEELYYGLQMQLIVYMNAAEEIYGKEQNKEVIPAGVFYYQLKDPIVKAQGEDSDEFYKSFRMSGYANEDREILSRLENSPDKFLYSMPVRLKRDGTPYSGAPVMNTEDFFALGKHVNKKMVEIGERIFSGEICPEPYRRKNSTACDYCPYYSVCGFDPSIPGFEYQSFPALSADEVLERLRKEEENG
ncbi:MAG: PD-(D/E)XK nuclease family protein [Lachnospiraceae bacterium]|nr:PD-(D/E)XK nuclease family protein [Lachnospiraceae bacterium]